MQPACCRVYFGTLLGMADHLAFTLGPAQYNPYKMVPYGPVPEVGHQIWGQPTPFACLCSPGFADRGAVVLCSC